MNSSKNKLWLKITAVILFVILSLVLAASVASVVFLGYEEVYFDGGKQLRSDAQKGYTDAAVNSIAYVFQSNAAPKAYKLTKENAYQGDTWEYDPKTDTYEKTAEGIVFDASKYPYSEPENHFGGDVINEYLLDEYAKGKTNYAFKIKDMQSGEMVFSNFEPDEDCVETLTHIFTATVLGDLEKVSLKFDARYEVTNYLKELEGGFYNSTVYFLPTESYISNTETPNERVWIVKGDYIPVVKSKYEITLYIPKTYPVKNYCAFVMSIVNFAIDNCYLPIITGVASIVLMIVIFIYLMCAAGHKEGADGITPNWIDKIPFDLYLCIVAVLGITLFFLTDELGYYSDIVFVVGLVVLGIVFILLLLSVLMTFATRAKRGTVLRNTVICMVLILIVKILKAILSLIKKMLAGVCYAFKNLKFAYRAVIIGIIIALFEFFTLVFIVEMPWARGFWGFVFIFGNLFLATFAVFYIIAFFKIRKCIKELSQGNPYAKVDDQYVFGVFKECADDLNSVGEGIQKAVAQSMKSERLKTELITNVSHDLKTPLTSIVNYIDILSKEDIQPAEAKEHVEVLVRQSQRMKKLIDDLIEASKASTGSTNVELTRSDVSMLLSQSVVEYEDKFADSDLTVKLSLPEKELVASLDGKLMWRVFDNVLGNICKYAQPGTRVYIGAVEKGDDIFVSFKNISRYELNITSDELMERFVRGDSSRSTEGSGLGLSIARSLCDLQNAALDIDIDGDLFKVGITVKKLGDEEITNA